MFVKNDIMRDMQIVLGGEIREVYVTKKRIRNLILRVEEDGSLKVSCPYGVDEKQIKDFIYEKADWIIKNEKRQVKKTNEILTGSNGTATWLGETYPVEMHMSNTDKIFFYEDKLVYYLKDMSKKHIDEVFYKYAKKELFKILTDKRTFLDEAICKENGKPYPYITIRMMTSRWGSCSPQRSHISMSTRLIHYPIECIHYVLIHEYSHILEANHSKAFYNVVRKYMPDYKKYEKMLNY